MSSAAAHQVVLKDHWRSRLQRFSFLVNTGVEAEYTMIGGENDMSDSSTDESIFAGNRLFQLRRSPLSRRLSYAKPGSVSVGDAISLGGGMDLGKPRCD